MQPSSAHILAAVRRTLSDRIAPSLIGSDSEALLQPIYVALAELLRRAQSPHDDDPVEQLTLQGLAEGRLLLEDDDITGGGPALIAMIGKVQDRLRTESEAHWRARASAWIDKLVRGQYAVAYPAPLPSPAVAAADEEATVGAAADEEPTIDQARLARRISEELAAGAAVTIDAMRILSGGFSRDTLLVSWSAGSVKDELVLRRQRTKSTLEGIALSVYGELPLMRMAREGGVPVPKTFWLEPDIALGGPYIAMERTRGSVIGSVMDAPDCDEAAIREVAQIVARLHQVRWEDHAAEVAPLFDLPVSGLTSRIAAVNLLDRWKRYWDKQTLDSSPALSAAYNWLRNNLPDSDARPVVLHGDIGFHNILFDNRRPTAPLDWETAYIGDPAKDMATREAFVTRFIDWPTFVGWYHEAGGPAFDEGAKRFYHVVRVFSYLLVSSMGWETLFADVPEPKIEMMLMGGPIRQHLFADYLNYLPIISGSSEAAPVTRRE